MGTAIWPRRFVIGGSRGHRRSEVRAQSSEVWVCARRVLGHTARDNPSEKIKSKWDKGERPNMGGSLGPRSVGPVSSADKSPGVRSRAPAVVSSEESVLLLSPAFMKVELPASKVHPMLIPFEGLAGTLQRDFVLCWGHRFWVPVLLA